MAFVFPLAAMWPLFCACVVHLCVRNKDLVQANVNVIQKPTDDVVRSCSTSMHPCRNVLVNKCTPCIGNLNFGFSSPLPNECTSYTVCPMSADWSQNHHGLKKRSCKCYSQLHLPCRPHRLSPSTLPSPAQKCLTYERREWADEGDKSRPRTLHCMY